MLVDMVVEVLGQEKVAVGSCVMVLGVQGVYLLWWGAALVSSLRVTSHVTGVWVLVVMLLNLFWTTKVLQEIVLVSVAGTMASCCTSQSQWSTTDATTNATHEKTATSRNSGPRQTSSAEDGQERDLDVFVDEFEQYLVENGDDETGFNEVPVSSEGQEGTPVRTQRRQQRGLYFRLALTSSFGSVCKASILSPLGQLRSMLVFIGSRGKESSRGRQRSRYGCCIDTLVHMSGAYHELALVHVAAYSTAFSRAVDEVWNLLQESGLEAVFEEDLVGPAMNWLSLSIAAFTAAGLGAAVHAHAGERWTLFTLVLFFIVHSCMMTVSEVLRSAVFAVYLQFVDNPDRVGEQQSFALIFHRLKRVSEMWKYEEQLLGGLQT
ncbi:unnamed protein product [Discosporangium mesarthrocarpum]